jgi:hypothetical protein
LSLVYSWDQFHEYFVVPTFCSLSWTKTDAIDQACNQTTMDTNHLSAHLTMLMMSSNATIGRQTTGNCKGALEGSFDMMQLLHVLKEIVST